MCTEMASEILIVGMSHVAAIKAALPKEQNARINVVFLKPDEKIIGPDGRIARPDFGTPSVICLCLAGNIHNIVGLFESPVPIAMANSKGHVVPDDRTRFLIPRAMMWAWFLEAHEKFFPLASALASAFSDTFPDSRIIHLCPPPPIADIQPILGNPGLFADKMHLGIAPRALRIALYELQVSLYRGVADRLGAQFILPPKDACDEDGFLLGEYSLGDPIHANAAYGRLVLSILASEIGNEASVGSVRGFG
jgi:hypothetical protein